jgi:hypothetical protein
MLFNANIPGGKLIGIAATFRNVGEEKIGCVLRCGGEQREVCAKKISIERGSWDQVLEEAQLFLNEFISPSDFHSLVLFEEEHPLEERESLHGTRNAVIYHHVTEENLHSLQNKSDENWQKVYDFKKVANPESKSWQKTYEEIARIST